MTDTLKLFERSTFVCGSCGAIFSAMKSDFQMAEDTGKLFAICPTCSKTAPEAHWMENLRQGHGKQTGPTTEAGKKRSSLNAMKHGSYSNSYLYPRDPGKYPECADCQDQDECNADKSGYCHRKIEIYHKFMLAIERGDPEAIKSIAAKNFAQAQMLINFLFHDIFRLGAILESPVYEKLTNAAGDSVLEKVEFDGNSLMEYKANPAINKVTEMLKTLGFTLPEFAATPKGQDEREILKGHLDDQAATRQTTEEYLHARTKAANTLGDILNKAKKLRHGHKTSSRIIEDHANDEDMNRKDTDGPGS